MDISDEFQKMAISDLKASIICDKNIAGHYVEIEVQIASFSIGDILIFTQNDFRGAFRLKSIKKSIKSNNLARISLNSVKLFSFDIKSEINIKKYVGPDPVITHDLILQNRNNYVSPELSELFYSAKLHGLFLENQVIYDKFVLKSRFSVSVDKLFLCTADVKIEPSYNGLCKFNCELLDAKSWLINYKDQMHEEIMRRIQDCEFSYLLLSSLDSLCSLLKLRLLQPVFVIDDIDFYESSEGQYFIYQFGYKVINLDFSAQPTIAKRLPTDAWNTIGGYKELISDITHHIGTIKNGRDDFSKTIGIRPPKGILLYGPPGCSKTMIARAIALSENTNFISIKGPEIFRKWVGDSEKIVSNIFKRARKSSPCVIFFDEFDSIGASRAIGSKNSVESRVVAQLLSEMDGLSDLNNVLVVAATNRPDIVDPALLRPGRFDLHFHVPLPDSESRYDIILKFFLHSRIEISSSDIKELVQFSDGFSGAEIVSGCQKIVISYIKSGLFSLVNPIFVHHT